MRLEWLEDLVAVIDHGSLTRAADARLLTQPAFSRRIRTIEEHIGVDLVDRGSRPVRLKPAVLAEEDRIRELATALRELLRDLRRHGAAYQNRVVIASQHAITTSVTPYVLRNHFPAGVSFRLRSANRDECYALVMTRQADLTLVYQTPADPFAAGDDLLEERSLGIERLVPVFARDELDRLEESRARGELPVILYPRNVFLGRHMEREVFPKLPRLALTARAETALTLAALQLALAGVGVAWVPRSLAGRDLSTGHLAELSSWLPESELGVAALRLSSSDRRSEVEEAVWGSLAKLGDVALIAKEEDVSGELLALRAG